MSKPIPEFKNEDEERAFWAKNDSSEYVDWSKAIALQSRFLRGSPGSFTGHGAVFPNLDRKSHNLFSRH